jgi:hypothetical protein
LGATAVALLTDCRRLFSGWTSRPSKIGQNRSRGAM